MLSASLSGGKCSSNNIALKNLGWGDFFRKKNKDKIKESVFCPKKGPIDT